MKKGILVFTILLSFFAGYVAGSVRTRNAIAIELGGVGSTVESLKNLGKTVVEMQQNIDKLQANVNSVKKIKDDISSYQGIAGGGAGKQIPQQLPAGGQGGLKQVVPGTQQLLPQ